MFGTVVRTALHCTTLYHTVPLFTTLYHSLSYCTTLYRTVPHSSMHRATRYYYLLYCFRTAVRSTPHSTTLYCNVSAPLHTSRHPLQYMAPRQTVPLFTVLYHTSVCTVPHCITLYSTVPLFTVLCHSLPHYTAP